MIGVDGLFVGRPSVVQLDALLDQAAHAALTYDHVGSTLSDSSRPSARVHTERLQIGRSGADFERACDGLRRWVCHDGIRARIHPADALLEVGQTLLVVLPAGPLAIVVPDRVVAVIDEPDRFGFAYGTLQGHHEEGEELFLVERRDDAVWATLRVDAVASSVPARLVAPGVRWFQHLAARRYLCALRDHVQRGSGR